MKQNKSAPSIADWQKEAETRLRLVEKDAEIAHQDIGWLTAHVFGRDRAWLATHAQTKVTPAKQRRLENLLKRRLRDEPLAYLLGTAPFFGREFIVNKNVLIPRPETEDLIELALNDLRSAEIATIIDVGTGSGAIAITMALERPRSKVIAIESSTRALTVAKQNVKKLRAKNVHLIKGNLLPPLCLPLIVGGGTEGVLVLANLPYLPLKDRKIMPKSVVAYEPKEALFANEDGMALNRKLLRQLAHRSDPSASSRAVATAVTSLGMTVILELDPPQASVLKLEAEKLFPNSIVKIKKDRCGRDRFLYLTTAD